jgi:hypothetical protein
MQPLLCRLWQRIDAEIPDGQEKAQTLQAVQALLDCAAE